jgi:glycosyltransferase involved in cell wall biosynthesis
MRILLSHPTGNQFVRALITSFQDAGMLARFVTTVAVTENAYWLKMLPAKLSEELRRRTFSVPADQMMRRPLLEIARNLLPKIGFHAAVKHETGFASLDRVYWDLDKAIAGSLKKISKRLDIDAVYAYEDGALETFIQAKKLGLTCIYDLPIAYWETGHKLMQEEALRLPPWSVTLGGGIADSEHKLKRKIKELELADVVVVPGKFVKDSLPVWARDKKIILAPFGSPESSKSVQKNASRPLRVLFAGSLGQRKGLGDLFAAMKFLDPKKIELIIMGGLLAPLEFYKREFADFIYEKGRPHDQVLELMRSCDVFCLPSIVEGRALVMQEAMSQGLPLLITPNTGGDDLVIEGETGFMVPVRSPEKIAEKLNWFIENREAAFIMGQCAITHAAKYTWKGYGDLIVKELTSIHV